MLSIVKVISTRIETIKDRLMVKFLRLGKDDVQECHQSGPYGIDSNPIEDMVAVYVPTMEKGRNVVIGYINPNMLTAVGEIRIYSTSVAGKLETYIYLKNDGTIEFMGDNDVLLTC